MKNDLRKPYFGDPLNYIRVLAMLMVFILHVAVANFYALEEPAKFLLRTPAWAGVWIFFFISGYFLCKGFHTGKYPFTVKGILKFWWARFVKIAPSYYLVIWLAHEMIGLNENASPKELTNLLTFNFDGTGSYIAAIGSLWFVSTIMKLYLLMPLIALVCIPLKKQRVLTAVLCGVVIALGLGLRLFMYNNDYSWYADTYVSVVGNLDIIISACLFALMRTQLDTKKEDGKERRWNYMFRFIAAVLIITLVADNCYIYFMNTAHNMFVYRYILPSIYILCTAFFVLCFDTGKTKRETAGKFHFIDFLSTVSFEFYMVHVPIKSLTAEFFNFAWMDNIWRYLVYLLIQFSLSLAAATAIHYATDGAVKLIKFIVNSVVKLIEKLVKKIIDTIKKGKGVNNNAQ